MCRGPQVRCSPRNRPDPATPPDAAAPAPQQPGPTTPREPTHEEPTPREPAPQAQSPRRPIPQAARRPNPPGIPRPPAPAPEPGPRQARARAVTPAPRSAPTEPLRCRRRLPNPLRPTTDREQPAPAPRDHPVPTTSQTTNRPHPRTHQNPANRRTPPASRPPRRPLRAPQPTRPLGRHNGHTHQQKRRHRRPWKFLSNARNFTAHALPIIMCAPTENRPPKRKTDSAADRGVPFTAPGSTSPDWSSPDRSTRPPPTSLGRPRRLPPPPTSHRCFRWGGAAASR